MPIIIRYNNDTAFRRRTAFLRAYRCSNMKLRMKIEVTLGAVFAVAAAVIWFTRHVWQFPFFIFYFILAIAVFLLARLIRAYVVSRKVHTLETERDFTFGDDGFTFGPIDSEGTLLETKWRDVDKAYFTDGVIYMMCMVKRHWIALDDKMYIEGTRSDLENLLREKLPKRRICDKGRKIK